MVDSIREDTVKMLLMIEVRPVQQGQQPAQAAPAQSAPAQQPAAPAAPAAPKAGPIPAVHPSQADVAALRQKMAGQSAGDRAAAAGQLSGGANKPVRAGKIGRNDPCPCGSGLKWKKCTCQQYHPDLYKQSK